MKTTLHPTKYKHNKGFKAITNGYFVFSEVVYKSKIIVY